MNDLTQMSHESRAALRKYLLEAVNELTTMIITCEGSLETRIYSNDEENVKAILDDSRLALRQCKLVLSKIELIPTSLRQHIVEDNETLESIALKELNDAKYWTAIAELNGLMDADSIKSGQVLEIPYVDIT